MKKKHLLPDLRPPRESTTKPDKPDIKAMISVCEELCDALRLMRRMDSNTFFDSAEEKLLKNLDGALTGYYRWCVDEPREVMKQKLEMQRLYERINELEREATAAEYEKTHKQEKSA